MDVFKSFESFEQKFGKGLRYSSVSDETAARLREKGLPDFYLDYVQTNGLKQFKDGFWWFVDPFSLSEDLAPFTNSKETLPIIRNAFGCFITSVGGSYYHVNIHTKNFGLLGDELGLVFNFTLVDDYALRDMFFGQLFPEALHRLGMVEVDQIYMFVPALALGGEPKAENLQVGKMREHMHLLAEL
jgi:hypothetical protein